MSGGIPVAIAMAGASLIYLLFAESSPPFVVIHRMVSGIDSFPAAGRALLHSGRQPDEQRGHHQPHLQLRAGLGGLAQGRLGPRECGGLGRVCRHERHSHCRRSRPGHHRDQGHERPWLQHRICGGRDGRLGHARPHHPTQLALCDLRHDGQRVGGCAVPCGHLARHLHGAAHDADGRLFRAQKRLGCRCEIRVAQSHQGLGRNRGGGGLASGHLVAGHGHGHTPSTHRVGGLDRFVCRRQVFQLSGRVAHHDPRDPDWRHDHRRVHPHRRRDCSLRLGHCTGLFLVPAHSISRCS